MTTPRSVLAAAVAALLLSLAPSVARALTFSASLDRFEADGNTYGSADGVFDLVDEFDDGTLAPNWVVLLGTVFESGGVLTARDPGVVLGSLGIPQELSTVESTAELENGEGSFTLVTHWDPAPLPVNRQFFFHLYGDSPVIESSGMTVNNFDAATAAAQGAPVGWSVGRQRVFPVGNQEPAVVDYVAIDPMTITGQVVLRMTFDDATDLLTCAFSLDGGTTFQSPFVPLQAFKRSPGAELLVGAAAIASTSLPPVCTVPISPVKVKFQKVSSPPGEQGFRMTGRILLPAGTPPDFAPVFQGVVLGAVSGLGPVTGYDVPPGAKGSGGCGPDDGWRHAGYTWTYVNKTGALPPLCEPASANGLRKVKMRDDRARRGELRFSIVARPTIVQFASGGPAVAVAWVGGLDAGGNPVTCANQPLSCLLKGSSVSCE